MPPAITSGTRVDAVRALALPVVAVLIGFAVVKSIIPAVQQPLPALRARRDGLQSAITMMSTLSPEQVAAARAAAAREGTAARAADARIPTQEDPGHLLNRLDQAAHETGVELGVLVPTQDSLFAPVALLPYGATSYRVRVRGSWAALTALLDGLAHDSTITLPSVRVLRAAPRGPGGPLAADLVLTLVSQTPNAFALTQADSVRRADSARAGARVAPPRAGGVPGAPPGLPPGTPAGARPIGTGGRS